MSSGPDLFVVCKSCGSEVSPYITECPYCGTRLRKRAPKLERGGVPKRAAPRAARAPQLPPPAAGEIPGIRADRRPYATIAAGPRLVAASRCASRSGRCNVVATSPTSWPRARSTATTGSSSRTLFVYTVDRLRGRGARRDRAVRLAARAPPRLRGRRCSSSSSAGAARRRRPSWRSTRTASRSAPTAPRSALLAAWAMRDVLGRRRGEEDDADLLGVLAIAVVLVLLPLAVDRARARSPGSSAASSGSCSGSLLARLRAALARRAIVPGSPATSRPTAQPSISPRPAHRGEQAAGGHRVAHQPAPRLGHAVGAGRERLGVARGCAASRRRARARRASSVEHAVDRRARRRRRSRPPARWPRASSCRWPSRPKPVTSVSACAPAARGLRGRAVVERRHHLDRPRDERRRPPARA